MAKHCFSADRIVPSHSTGQRLRRRRRRRPVLEILEDRSFLNGGQLAPGNADPPLPSPSSPMVAGFSGDLSAGAQQQSNDGVIALLFDPHQPKSALPANVTFAGGPPLQQGAPPRYSYNLQDNILGAGALGPEAMFVASEGINAPIPFPEQVIDIVGKLVKENFEAFVVSTPFGMPNFSFGPDTRVLGPQLAPSHQPKAENEPSSGESGGAANEDEHSPADEDAPQDDEPRSDSANDRGVRESSRQRFEASAKAPQEARDGSKAVAANFIAPALRRRCLQTIYRGSAVRYSPSVRNGLIFVARFPPWCAARYSAGQCRAARAAAQCPDRRALGDLVCRRLGTGRACVSGSQRRCVSSKCSGPAPFFARDSAAESQVHSRCMEYQRLSWRNFSYRRVASSRPSSGRPLYEQRPISPSFPLRRGH